MPAYICTDPERHLETEIAVLYGNHGTEEAHRIADAVNALASNRSAIRRIPEDELELLREASRLLFSVPWAVFGSRITSDHSAKIDAFIAEHQ